MRIYLGDGFVIFSGRQGDVILRDDLICVIPLFGAEFLLEHDDLLLALNAIS